MKIPDGVGWTALMTAYARAEETARVDALFHDQWARTVTALTGDADLEDAGLPALGPVGEGPSELWSSLITYFATRTPFYDECVLAGTSEGTDQVVLLAAGFDGRARRLALPVGTTVYEVDTAPVLDFKEAAVGRDALPSGVERRPVRVDLRGDWAGALAGAGYDADRPAVWLIEGLLMYLDAEQADRLLDTVVSLAAPGSRLAAEWFDRSHVAERLLAWSADDEERRVGELVGGLFRSGPSGPPHEWLGRHGWASIEATVVNARAVHHGRPATRMFDPGHPAGVGVHLAAARRA